MTVQTRRVPDLFTRADVVSYNADDNTIEVCFATQTPVRSWDWDNWQAFNEVLVVTSEAMRKQRFEQGAPFLKDHRNSTDSVLGTTESVRIENNKAFARIRLSKNPIHAGVITDIKDGIIRNVSVGYKVYRYEKMPQSENDQLPTYRAVDWEPHEVSAVGVPADANAQVRNDGGERNLSTVIIEERIMPNETNPPVTPPVATTNDPVTAPAPATPPIDVDAVRTAAQKEERARAAEIALIARAANLPQDFIDQHIAAGTQLDAVRTAAFAAMASAQPPTPKPANVQVGVDARDKQIERMQNALLSRNSDYKGERNTDFVQSAQPYRNWTLKDMAVDCLRKKGINPDGLSSNMEIVGRAFTSTDDFPILLEGTIRRTLLSNYATQSDTWRKWCSIGSVNDFRRQERIRSGMFGTLDALTENSEFKNKAIPDAEKTSVGIGTVGNTISLSRQAIINDDLGAFTTLAARLGRAAALTIEKKCYALLLSNPVMSDGKELFHPDHKNIAPSAGAPSVERFEELRQLMRKQMDFTGNEYLDLNLDLLLTPVGIYQAANLLNRAQFNVDEVSKFQVPNIVAGLFREVVDSPHLTGTAYYGFAPKDLYPTFEVSFLNGVQEPYMEMEQGFSVDGAKWKVRLDFGVDAIDWRTVVKNAGA